MPIPPCAPFEHVEEGVLRFFCRGFSSIVFRLLRHWNAVLSSCREMYLRCTFAVLGDVLHEVPVLFISQGAYTLSPLSSVPCVQGVSRKLYESKGCKMAAACVKRLFGMHPHDAKPHHAKHAPMYKVVRAQPWLLLPEYACRPGKINIAEVQTRHCFVDAHLRARHSQQQADA